MANYCIWSGATGTGVGTVAGSTPTSAEWTNAFVSFAAFFTAVTTVIPAGSIIFVASDHLMTTDNATHVLQGPTAGYMSILSVSRATGALVAGAKEDNQFGGSSFNIEGGA